MTNNKKIISVMTRLLNDLNEKINDIEDDVELSEPTLSNINTLPETGQLIYICMDTESINRPKTSWLWEPAGGEGDLNILKEDKFYLNISGLFVEEGGKFSFTQGNGKSPPTPADTSFVFSIGDINPDGERQVSVIYLDAKLPSPKSYPITSDERLFNYPTSSIAFIDPVNGGYDRGKPENYILIMTLSSNQINLLFKDTSSSGSSYYGLSSYLRSADYNADYNLVIDPSLPWLATPFFIYWNNVANKWQIDSIDNGFVKDRLYLNYNESRESIFVTPAADSIKYSDTNNIPTDFLFDLVLDPASIQNTQKSFTKNIYTGVLKSVSGGILSYKNVKWPTQTGGNWLLNIQVSDNGTIGEKIYSSSSSDTKKNISLILKKVSTDESKTCLQLTASGD